MKKITSILATGMIASVFILSSALTAGTMTGESGVTIRYATNIIGAEVSNMQGEKLGKIIDLTIEQNRITFAVLSHGGILGIGEKITPIPIDALTFKGEKTVLVNISKNKLAKAPTFERSQRPDFSNRQWTEDTYRFYGAQPFWKEGSTEPVMKEDHLMKEHLKEKMQEMYDEKMKPKN
jgi:sporulation protein YlmC with PRC-barrel domain